MLRIAVVLILAALFGVLTYATYGPLWALVMALIGALVAVGLMRIFW